MIVFPETPSILDQIREDTVADALEAPAGKRTRNEWREPVSWSFNGYLARIKGLICPLCGGEDWISEGVFVEELGTNGTRKLVACSTLVTGMGHRMELRHEDSKIPCVRCLSPSFSNLIEEPDVPTNISGQGFTTPRPRQALGFTRKD
jgi:hypothetical protein